MSDRKAEKLLVRMPPDVRRWLEDEAARNLSPMTCIVVQSLRMRMEAEQRA
jgi:hypothetical protein